MKVHSDYLYVINRLLQGQKAGRPQRGEKAEPPSGETQELSRLTARIARELKELEQQPDAQRAERLKYLQEQLDKGTYRPDLARVAEAMLRRDQEN
ncbi:MAG TPA: flagellar biosynthesis anti-sigma factor FlgM [Bacillota bacterium]|jgi:anti-sigma28 factor (negative regulator of flagellin synthesis)|nr:flagellar biosynthesis anti-sigma factor FlgM [Bacillota bacterium]